MLPEEYFELTFQRVFFVYSQIDLFVDLKVAKFHSVIIFSFRGHILNSLSSPE